MSVEDRGKFFEGLKPHSWAKVKLLESYITLWIRKITLGLRKKCLICDTFAGEGIYEDGTFGSPIIIINSALDYLKQKLPRHEDVYLTFIESDKCKYLKLRNIIEKKFNCKLIDNKFNNVRQNLYIVVFNSTHNELLDNLQSSVCDLMPSLFFINPFGFKDISFSGITNMLNKYTSCEVIINFMYEEFNRFKSNSGIDEALTGFFGSDTSCIKKDTENMNSRERRNYIIDKYKENLLRSGVKYTLDFDIQKDESTAYKMALVFSSNSKYGFNTMKETMFKLSKNIQFEYRTHENSELTIFSGFEMDMAIEEMANILYENFKGKIVSHERIETYCTYHEFIPDNMVTKLLKNLSSNGKITIIKNGIEKKNPKQFKDCLIKFCR